MLTAPAAALLHGSLGYWDEIGVIGVAALFAFYLIWTLLRGRNLPPDLEQPPRESDER